ncbi:MAG TPA: ABC transporter permease, partial [Thermoanaerobaculia bacterium]
MRSIWNRLRREPGLSLTVVATIAVGVGAATAIFVYLASYLVTRLPARDPSRLVHVHCGTEADPTAGCARAELEAIVAAGIFEEVASNQPSGGTVAWRGESRFAWGQAVTPSYFSLFAARPALGRLLVASDARTADAPPVVLSHRLWRDLFDGDPAALGAGLEINGAPYVVVGVTEREFQGVGYASEWFVPLGEIDRLTGLARLDDPLAKFLFVWGLVPSGAGGAERAQSAFATLTRALDAQHPLAEGARRVANLRPATLLGSNAADDPYYLAARLLAVAAILFLLLGATNVSGLLLARATARDHEWAVRKAMGAGPARLFAGLCAEILPLAALGFAGATAVAAWILRWIERSVITPVGGLGTTWAVEDTRFLHLDSRALGFAFAATALALALAVAAPLARVLRRSPARALGAG